MEPRENPGPLPAEVEQLLKIVCQQILQELGASSCSLSQWDRARNTITTQITYAIQPDLEKPRFHADVGVEYRLDDYPVTARVLQEQVPVIVRKDDPLADPAEVAYLEEMGQRVNLMVPLTVGDRAIGFLSIHHRESSRLFTSEEITRACSLARQAALVVEGGHLFVEARRELKDLAALLEASSDITSSLELGAVLQSVSKHFVHVIGVEGCILLRYDPVENRVQSWAKHFVTGVPSPVDAPDAYALQSYPPRDRVLNERVPVVIQEDDPTLAWEERAEMQRREIKSLLLVPLQAYGRVIGLVELMSRSYRRDFGRREIELALTLANQAATAIENARLYARVQEQLDELRKAHEAQARLLKTVQEMSTPVIPVHDQILVMPLIGTVDSERARQLTQRMLEEVQQQRARVVLVDITGVALVDTATAQALIRAAYMVRLLGAEMVLVGTRPEVAQTLVLLGVDMGGLVSMATLQNGVEYALKRLGLSIVAGNSPPWQRRGT